MQAADNQVCHTQTPHSTTIKTITGISDCGGEYPGGQINLHDDENVTKVIGTGWVDNLDGSYTATNVTNVDTNELRFYYSNDGTLTLGNTYNIRFTVSGLAGGNGIFHTTNGRSAFAGSNVNITADGDYDFNLVCDSVVLSRGSIFRAALATPSSYVLSNLQLYDLGP